MNEIKLPIEFFYELEKLPMWNVKKIMKYVRTYSSTGFIEGMKPKLFDVFVIAKVSIDEQKEIINKRKKSGKRGAKNRWESSNNNENGKKMAKNGKGIAKNNTVMAKSDFAITQNEGENNNSLPDFKREIHNILGADYD